MNKLQLFIDLKGDFIMTKYKQNERIPFTDDLMFSMVMRDENICRRLLERILPNEEFGEIRIENPEGGLYVETQKSIKFPLGAHGVRLDAFIKSGNVWAEIELQTYAGEPSISDVFSSTELLLSMQKYCNKKTFPVYL